MDGVTKIEQEVAKALEVRANLRKIHDDRAFPVSEGNGDSNSVLHLVDYI